MKTTIHRINLDELMKAIADLEKRGFTLIRIVNKETDQKQFNYRENKGQKLKYSHSDVYRDYWAVLRKDDENERAK